MLPSVPVIWALSLTYETLILFGGLWALYFMSLVLHALCSHFSLHSNQWSQMFCAVMLANVLTNVTCTFTIQ